MSYVINSKAGGLAPWFYCVALGMEGAFLGMRSLGNLRVHAAAFLWLFGVAFLCFLVAARQLLRHHEPRWSLRRAIMLLGITGLLFRLTLLPLPPTLSDDIYRYLWDGRVQLAGINPYAYAPNAPELASLRTAEFDAINHQELPTIYPPLTQAMFRAAAAAQPTILGQKAIFLVWDFLLLVLVLVALPRWGVARQWALLYAWNPLVIVEVAGSGHNDVLGLFWFVLGCWLWTWKRDSTRWGAAVAWGLCFLSKFVSALLLPWLLLRRGCRRYALGCAAVVVVGYLPSLPEALQSWGHGLQRYGAPWEFNSFGYAFLLQLVPHPSLVRTAILVCLAIWVMLMARRHDDLPRYLMATLAAAILLVPVVEPWYVLWLLPFLCIRPRWPWLAFTGLVALSYTVLIGYVRDGTWQIPLWAKVAEYGGLLALLAWEWTSRRLGSLCSPRPLAAGGTARISVIIPALNEEAGIAAVLRELPRELVREVIVVDNGSSDRTAEAASAAGARVIREPRRGYGQACLSGIAALSPDTDVVVFMDADHSDYPEDLPRLIAPIQQGAADVVIGSRVLGGASPGSLTPQQRFGNWLACRLIAWRFGYSYTDLGPFRAIRREALDILRMRDRDFGWTVEMQVKALQQGLRVTEVSVRYRPRLGRSKISGTLQGTLRAGVKILGTIARSWVAPPHLKKLYASPPVTENMVCLAHDATSDGGPDDGDLRSHRRWAGLGRGASSHTAAATRCGPAGHRVDDRAPTHV